MMMHFDTMFELHVSTYIPFTVGIDSYILHGQIWKFCSSDSCNIPHYKNGFSTGLNYNYNDDSCSTYQVYDNVYTHQCNFVLSLTPIIK
jgi:hypothetical protein